LIIHRKAGEGKAETPSCRSRGIRGLRMGRGACVTIVTGYNDCARYFRHW
jgi:hypothetical protein